MAPKLTKWPHIFTSLPVYKYVGCATGMIPFEGNSWLLYTLHGCHICFIIHTKCKTQKGIELTKTRYFGYIVNNYRLPW